MFEGKFVGAGGVIGHYVLKLSIFGEAPSGCDAQFTGQEDIDPSYRVLG